MDGPVAVGRGQRLGRVPGRVLDPVQRRRDRAQMAERAEGRSRDRRARRRDKHTMMARPGVVA